MTVVQLKLIHWKTVVRWYKTRCYNCTVKFTFKIIDNHKIVFFKLHFVCRCALFFWFATFGLMVSLYENSVQPNNRYSFDCIFQDSFTFCSIMSSNLFSHLQEKREKWSIINDVFENHKSSFWTIHLELNFLVSSTFVVCRCQQN